MQIATRTVSNNIPCQGISVRTTNQDESNTKSAKIGEMWQNFYQNYFAKLPEDSDIYGIYHNYESDTNGAFDVTAGWHQVEDSSLFDTNDLITVTIPKGKYLVFSEKGDMPDAVINAWQNVWAYFNNADSTHTRLYNIDFEHYVSESQVDVYIGIE